MALTGLVNMLEQALARKLMAVTNQTGKPPVIDGDLLLGATLAAKNSRSGDFPGRRRGQRIVSAACAPVDLLSVRSRTHKRSADR